MSFPFFGITSQLGELAPASSRLDVSNTIQVSGTAVVFLLITRNGGKILAPLLASLPSTQAVECCPSTRKSVDSVLALTPSSLRTINDTCSELRSAQSADRDCESQRAARADSPLLVTQHGLPRSASSRAPNLTLRRQASTHCAIPWRNPWLNGNSRWRCCCRHAGCVTQQFSRSMPCCTVCPSL